MINCLSKEERNSATAVFDVLKSEVIYVAHSPLLDHPEITELITKENGVVVTHTITLFAPTMNSLILKLYDYVCHPQNAIE